MCDAQTVKHTDSIGHPDPRRDPGIDPDRGYALRPIKIDADPRRHLDPGTAEHHVAPCPGRDVVPRREERIEALGVRVVRIGKWLVVCAKCFTLHVDSTAK